MRHVPDTNFLLLRHRSIAIVPRIVPRASATKIRAKAYGWTASSHHSLSPLLYKGTFARWLRGEYSLSRIFLGRPGPLLNRFAVGWALGFQETGSGASFGSLEKYWSKTKLLIFARSTVLFSDFVCTSPIESHTIQLFSNYASYF